jgi:hypothetical protein
MDAEQVEAEPKPSFIFSPQRPSALQYSPLLHSVDFVHVVSRIQVSASAYPELHRSFVFPGSAVKVILQLSGIFG